MLRTFVIRSVNNTFTQSTLTPSVISIRFVGDYSKKLNEKNIPFPNSEGKFSEQVKLKESVEEERYIREMEEDHRRAMKRMKEKSSTSAVKNSEK